MKKLLVILSFAFLLVSCSDTLYKYYDYDNLVYSYGARNLSEKEMKRFVKKYSRIADSPKGKRKLPPPGACAEYAYLLFLQDKKDKAKEYFIKETLIYPESIPYINTLMKELGL